MHLVLVYWVDHDPFVDSGSSEKFANLLLLLSFEFSRVLIVVRSIEFLPFSLVRMDLDPERSSLGYMICCLMPYLVTGKCFVKTKRVLAVVYRDARDRL